MKYKGIQNCQNPLYSTQNLMDFKKSLPTLLDNTMKCELNRCCDWLSQEGIDWILRMLLTFPISQIK